MSGFTLHGAKLIAGSGVMLGPLFAFLALACLCALAAIVHDAIKHALRERPASIVLDLVAVLGTLSAFAATMAATWRIDQ